MSDRGRERAPLEVEVWKSSQMLSVQAVRRSLHRMVRLQRSIRLGLFRYLLSSLSTSVQAVRDNPSFSMSS